jgi:hypothetical protein
VGDGVGSEFVHLETADLLAITVRQAGTPAVGMIELEGVGRTAAFVDASAGVTSSALGTRLGPVAAVGNGFAVGMPTYDGGAGGAVALFLSY